MHIMKIRTFIILLFSCIPFISVAQSVKKAERPWNNGPLVVSEEHRYLKHTNGKPFFWLGDTGWLMPQRLNRDEVDYYLKCCHEAGINVVQIQTLNTVPSFNVYGQASMPGERFDFKDADKPGVYGYWNHMDYIVKTAERYGIYIGMVCVWGGNVKHGKVTENDARVYGQFLAERYKNSPNIVWIIGGDLRGDIGTKVWNALADAIKTVDKTHLMTFHPRGRTVSSIWFNNASWLDFNMFQSGHRRYGQGRGETDSPIKDNEEEDNWRFVDYSLRQTPLKPVLDGEPGYEDIPQGLHDPKEPRWQASDVRRYAYWSVFAGSCGHTYGNNSVMQFYRPGYTPAYAATMPWYDALKNPGFLQMKYLKRLMLSFPYFERIPDQRIIVNNGERYNHLVATRGKRYLLVYNYSGIPMQLDLTKITGERKSVWWFCPSNGRLTYAGDFDNKVTTFIPSGAYNRGADCVLIATDVQAGYIGRDWKELYKNE